MNPGVAVPGEKRNAEKAWHVWRHYHPHHVEDARAAFLAAYERAYLDCVDDQVQFAGLEAAIHRLADLLDAIRIERDAVWTRAGELSEQEHDERAYAWALSNANAEEHDLRAMDQEQEELPF